MLDNDNMLDCVMLEVQRMWPPFFGGRRLVRRVIKPQPSSVLICEINLKGLMSVHVCTNDDLSNEVFQ